MILLLQNAMGPKSNAGVDRIQDSPPFCAPPLTLGPSVLAKGDCCAGAPTHCWLLRPAIVRSRVSVKTSPDRRRFHRNTDYIVFAIPLSPIDLI